MFALDCLAPNTDGASISKQVSDTSDPSNSLVPLVCGDSTTPTLQSGSNPSFDVFPKVSLF